MNAAARVAALPVAARRTLAIAMLAVALLLAWGALIMPTRALLSSQETWRQETMESIASDRGTLALADSLRTAGEALKTSSLPARLFTRDAAGGVDLQLQEDLRAALTQSGVEPTNFKSLPAVTYRGLRAHRVEFASNMTIDQLQAFFVALDGRPHYVRVDRLQLSAPSTQRENENPRINVLMEVRGFSLDSPAATPVRVAHAN